METHDKRELHKAVERLRKIASEYNRLRIAQELKYRAANYERTLAAYNFMLQCDAKHLQFTDGLQKYFRIMRNARSMYEAARDISDQFNQGRQ